MKTTLVAYDAKADGSGIAYWSDGSITIHSAKRMLSWFR